MDARCAETMRRVPTLAMEGNRGRQMKPRAPLIERVASTTRVTARTIQRTTLGNRILLNREIVVFRRIVVFDLHFPCEMAMLRACAFGDADEF